METMVKFISTAGVGFVCAKTLKVLGKKDCADIINGVTVAACGVIIVTGVVDGWRWLSNTEVVKAADKTLDGAAWIISKFIEIGQGIQDTVGDGIVGKGIKGMLERGVK